MMPQYIIRNKASPSGETTPAPIIATEKRKKRKDS